MLHTYFDYAKIISLYLDKKANIDEKNKKILNHNIILEWLVL